MTAPLNISFDCLPLRSIGRVDVPLDVSPEWETRALRMRAACERHGQHNSYYLHNGHCVLHLTNDPEIGVLTFFFEGTVLTDAQDRKTVDADLTVELDQANCDWLTATALAWLQESVTRAVCVEFDRYIHSGDLRRTVQRLRRLESEVNARGGFVGLGL